MSRVDKKTYASIRLTNELHDFLDEHPRSVNIFTDDVGNIGLIQVHTDEIEDMKSDIEKVDSDILKESFSVILNDLDVSGANMVSYIVF